MVYMSDYLSTIRNKKIIFFILNWGLGHATRSIPIIEDLINNNNNIILVSSGNAKEYLQSRFSDLTIKSSPDYKVTYASNSLFTQIKLLFQLPKLLYVIVKEKKLLNELVVKYHPDLVISDSCYGAYSKSVKSIFITHQLTIQSSIFNKIINYINFKKLQKFNQILIPDYSNHLLSRDLSSLRYSFQKSLVVSFIKPQSRFKNTITPFFLKDIFDFAIVSGPEPQKSHFFNFLISKYSISGKRLKIAISGLNHIEAVDVPTNIIVIFNIDDTNFLMCVLNAEKIIARSGYSTIMDLYVLNSLQKVLFYPTKGQTEQEYLSKIHSIKKP